MRTSALFSAIGMSNCLVTVGCKPPVSRDADEEDENLETDLDEVNADEIFLFPLA